MLRACLNFWHWRPAYGHPCGYLIRLPALLSICEPASSAVDGAPMHCGFAALRMTEVRNRGETAYASERLDLFARWRLHAGHGAGRAHDAAPTGAGAGCPGT